MICPDCYQISIKKQKYLLLDTPTVIETQDDDNIVQKAPIPIEWNNNDINQNKSNNRLSKFTRKYVILITLVLLALIIFITLMTCLVGIRGIYVNINDPNEFYSFTATKYEYHSVSETTNKEIVTKGTWKVKNDKLYLTHKDKDYGVVTDECKLQNFKNKELTLTYGINFENKFKRVALANYSACVKKAKIYFNETSGYLYDSNKEQKIKIGSIAKTPSNPVYSSTYKTLQFKGWYTTRDGWKDGTGNKFIEGARIWEDVTYYANWQNLTDYQISFEGNICDITESMTAQEGQPLIESIKAYLEHTYNLSDIQATYYAVTSYGKDTELTELSTMPAYGIEIKVNISSAILDIPEGTKVIEVEQYANLPSYVNTIIIPSSITDIKEHAFKNCSGLATVYLNAIDCKNAGEKDSSYYPIFKNCYKLNTIYIGRAVKSIPSFIFANCSSIKNINIPNNVTKIGKQAFTKCSGLVSINIPSSVTNIGEGAFYDCISLQNLTVPAGITSIRDWTFKGCSSLLSLSIPNSVKNIGIGTFKDCSKLRVISIPSGVTSIGKWAFSGCPELEKITIPVNITGIEEWTFSDCSKLTTISIPDSVTSIGNGAFYNCAELSNITTLHGITSIGDWAFSGCSKLKSIDIPSNISNIGEGAFKDCAMLSDFNIPNNITSIENWAFAGCSSFTNISIHNIKAIGNWAFKDCVMLSDITISENVSNIGLGAFENCFGLKVVHWNASNCSGAGDFSHPIFTNCTNLSTIYIDDKIKSIPDYAFSDCSALTNITIPNNVTYIGSSAFDGCSALTSITIPNSIKCIEDYTFWGCSNLIQITISTSVNIIEPGAFGYCSRLSLINFLGSRDRWNAIAKNSNPLFDWDYKTGDYIIECSDGRIYKSLY